MSYTFIDGYGSVLTANSSIISGSGTTGVQMPIINIASILSPVPVSLSGNSSVSGVGVFNTNNIGNGSILAVIPGSVATVSSPASVSGVGIFNINHIGNGSIVTVANPASVSGVGLFNVNHSGNGSVITVWSFPSIVGTYAEDAGHATTNQGIFTLGVRNDTVASFVSADLDYTPRAVDSAGRTITKPFAPDQASVFGVGSVNGAASVILMPAPGTGLKNYLTDFTVANTGAATTLIRITAGGASVLAFTIAPTGGGSNMIGLATPISAPPNSPINFAADTASSVVYGTAYGYKAP